MGTGRSKKSDMNEMIRRRAGKATTEAGAESEKGRARGRTPAASEGITLEDVDKMSLEELDEALPEAEEAVEATAAELADLTSRRDAAVGVVAAIRARLTALEEGQEA